MENKKIVVGEIETNCYILVSQNELIVIDPGGEGEQIWKIISNTKATFRYIINTHFHFDHVLANRYLLERSKAKLLIHKDEEKYIDFNVDSFLKNNESISIGGNKLEVIHTPGHTAGSICLIENEQIFTGDTLFWGTYGRTDLPGGSNEMMLKSLEKLKNLIRPGMTVYPGHGKTFKYKEGYLEEIINKLK